MVRKNFTREERSFNWQRKQFLVEEEILPVGIMLPDQMDFPGAVPFLDLLFPLNSCRWIKKWFVIDQTSHMIVLCEALEFLVFVLIDPCLEVARKTDIRHSMWFAGKDVHESTSSPKI